MVKTITIMDSVYVNLLKFKKKDESFSELFTRFIATMGSMETLIKLRGVVEFSKKSDLLKEINKKRGERRI